MEIIFYFYSKMTHRIDLYDLSNGFTNQKIIATFKDKFYYQKELYSSFYNQLYTILSSIDDDTCKELIEQMNQLKNVFIYANEMISEYKNTIDIVSILAKKMLKKKEKYNHIKSENESLHLTNNELSSQSKKIENDYELLSNDYIKLIQQTSSLKSSDELYSSNVHNNIYYINQLRKNSILNQEIKEQKETIDILKSEKDELNRQISIIQNEMTILKFETNSTISKLEKDNNDLLFKLNTIHKKNDTVSLEIENLNQELLTFNSQKTSDNENSMEASTQCNSNRKESNDENSELNENEYLTTLELCSDFYQEENEESLSNRIQITPKGIIDKMKDNKFSNLVKDININKEKSSCVDKEKEDNLMFDLVDGLYLFDFVSL